MKVKIQRVHGAEVHQAAPDPDLIAAALLDDAERRRCAGYHHTVDAARHATGRVLAKRAAGAWLGVQASRVEVRPDVGVHVGRPRLWVDDAACDLHLSIAHSGEVVLVALAPRPCGVDVEVEQGMADVIDSDVVFAPAERSMLQALPEASRLAWAARRWTLKEALLKATGRGLNHDPASLTPDAPVIELYGLRLRHWPLRAPEGHHASLAIAEA